MNHTDRKAEIIDASITLFCEKGLDLTSMQDIAAATGISKATLYFYFDSKAALIQEVYQHLEYNLNKNTAVYFNYRQ